MTYFFRNAVASMALISLTACGGSSTSGTGGGGGSITTPPSSGSALSPTITAADVRSFETRFAELDALFPRRSIPFTGTAPAIVNYEGQMEAEFRLDRSGDDVGDMQRLLADVDVRIDYSNPSPQNRIRGTVDNFNLIDTSGEPVEALRGDLNITGAVNSPGTRDLVANAVGFLEGRFGQPEVGTIRNVVMTLNGEIRGTWPVDSPVPPDPWAAITGDVGGSGSGDYFMTTAKGDFYLFSQ